MPLISRRLVRALSLLSLQTALQITLTDRCFAADTPQAPPQAAQLEFFEKKIRPLLAENCYNCHSASNKAAGGLRVDDQNGLLEGGGRGPGVVPGRPEESWLIRAVKQTDPALQMPPGKQLTPEQIADLTRWIADGAVWPAVDVPEDLGKWSADYEELRQTHWAWQPRKSPELPQVAATDWPLDDIDRFILAQLEQAGLQPVADAEPLALLRRITFDLTGLPPTPSEISEFLADPTPSAYAAVVDRLLASPAFGERWGRHWLDVARYGESTGSARNLPYPHAWRYRDYVIDSFNRDKPYNIFIREQLAGDLLPAATAEARTEHLVATGFLALGVKDVNQRFKIRFTMDNIDEQIDTVTRSVLALTVSCARCHDHKFDPIPVTDYYALAGIFQSSDLCAGLRNQMGGSGLAYYVPAALLTLGSPAHELSPLQAEQLAAAQAAVAEAQQEFETLRGTSAGAELAANGRTRQQLARQKLNRLQAELRALNDPAASGPVAHGVREATRIADAAIRIRGEAEQLGPVVPRGFLSILDFPNQPEIPSGSSGRLELALWLTDSQNPLTPRVAVNRIWQHLMGRGIVSTVDNFGTTGDAPSHPELLEHLATRFIDSGWSFKSLIRAIALSRTYQLSTNVTDVHVTVDPANRLLWRHSPRRLAAEEIRDAMLAASGQLDSARPENSPSRSLKVMELRNNGPEARDILTFAASSRHRSVYLPLLRTLVPHSLEVFDFAEQGMVTGARDTTTVPAQALYLLNDPFVSRQALLLAEALEAQAELNPEQKLQQVWLRILGRPATADEVRHSQSWLADYADIVSSLPDTTGSDVTERLAERQPVAAAASGQPAATNPDDVEQTDELPAPEIVRADNPQTAAWHSLIQALFGSAEFRYVR